VFVAEDVLDCLHVIDSVFGCAEEILDFSDEDAVKYCHSMVTEEICEDSFLVGLQVDKKVGEEPSQKVSGRTVKFDSACSRNMSGSLDRISRRLDSDSRVVVRGFNGSMSEVSAQGLNEDGKLEYYVQAMPTDLTLLCANDYAKDGAAVLLPDSGLVVRLTDKQRKSVLKYMSKYPVTKQLRVNNRTYEVIEGRSALAEEFSMGAVERSCREEAYSNTATRYFVSKVNVSNNEERILAMLLTGLSFSDLYAMARLGSVGGLPSDVTIASLNTFEGKYGRTPDVLRMALPDLAGNKKGYMAIREKVTRVSQRVESDYFQCEFNEILYEDSEKSKKKTVKLPSLGGAVANFLAVDGFSEYVHFFFFLTSHQVINYIHKRSQN
jgi:hypothetical protein